MSETIDATRMADWRQSLDRAPGSAPRPVIVSRSGSWAMMPVPRWHSGPAIRGFRTDDSLTIRLDGRAGLSLLLLCHPWSGRVEIAWDNAAQAHDLYVESGERLLEIPIQSDGETLVEIRNLGRAHEAARGAECWLIGFRRHATLWPIEAGEPVSRATRLIHGDIGTFLTARADTGMSDALALHGVWREEDVRRFAEHVLPGMTVIDAGANFGHHAIALSRLVGPTGRVLAIEPQRRAHHLLCANIAINDSWNVVTARRALGEAAGTARMECFKHEDGGDIGGLGVAPDTLAPGQRAGEPVRMATLDSVVAEHLVGRRIDFINVDVQGSELCVLLGGRRVLAESRPILRIAISPRRMLRRGHDHREIRWLLEGLGYRCLDMTPGRKTDKGEYVWDGVTDMEWDMLALPDPGAAPTD